MSEQDKKYARKWKAEIIYKNHIDTQYVSRYARAKYLYKIYKKKVVKVNVYYVCIDGTLIKRF